jgi:hypothetical protein
MIVSLPNGKCIEVSIETYLRMTDEDFEYLLAINWGEHFEDPFHSSVLSLGEQKVLTDEDLEDLGVDDLSELEEIDPTDEEIDMFDDED